MPMRKPRCQPVQSEAASTNMRRMSMMFMIAVFQGPKRDLPYSIKLSARKQEAAAACWIRAGSWCALKNLLGQQDAEGGAGARAGARLDAAAMVLGHLAADGEPEPGTPELGPGVQAAEEPEDLIGKMRLEADAVVGE